MARGEPAASSSSFEVHLENFTGPFDLLLSLIARHRLDVTEIALAEVTDEFIAHIRGHDGWDLSTASDFLVVAATLLELKALRLLPAGPDEDPEDLALLEARDLLFARLLQYRAFKEVSARFGARLARESRRHPRAVALEPHLAGLLPELVWELGPTELAAIAAAVLTRPKAPTEVEVGHLHASPVSVAEQGAIVAERLRRRGAASFRELVADAGGTAVVIARFLALLELYRSGTVAFDQIVALGELTIRWTGGDRAPGAVDEFEEYEGAEAPEEASR